MTERPILFSGPMVRAILDGNKTQTRRPVKVQPGDVLWGSNGLEWSWLDDRPPVVEQSAESIMRHGEYDPDPPFIRCPYGVPGDRLWVKETHALLWPSGEGPPDDKRDHIVEFAADVDAGARPGGWPIDTPGGPKWRPSIFMPRWASRITLEVTDVRVQRLQDITEEDALAEGVRPLQMDNGSALPRFEGLWCSINGEGSWTANPWVWAISFKRVTP